MQKYAISHQSDAVRSMVVFFRNEYTDFDVCTMPVKSRPGLLLLCLSAHVCAVAAVGIGVGIVVAYLPFTYLPFAYLTFLFL